MDVAEVQRRVDEVREMAQKGDDESAHVLEDALHLGVLVAIATAQQNTDEPHELARWALETRNIDFGRWYA